MLFIEYPKCSTCKKAKLYLEANNIKYTDRNIITETPTKNELKEWIKKYNFKIDKLYNTSGQKYRELNLKGKRKGMTEDEELELLSSDGMLIKRPIFITSKHIVTGFREKEVKEILEDE